MRKFFPEDFQDFVYYRLNALDGNDTYPLALSKIFGDKLHPCDFLEMITHQSAEPQKVSLASPFFEK